MNRSIKANFAYNPREEVGTQLPAETLEKGSGTCRDYAYLMIEAARSLGFGARFVTGYLYDPKLDGGRDDGTTGAGATHAWCEIYLPGAGWVEYDPTNALIGSAALIRVAVTRDPTQASPVSGSYVGEPEDYLGMEVVVTVTSGEASDDAAAAESFAKRRNAAARSAEHDPCRHRRLDLRALARAVLSEGAAAGAGARLCEPARHLDRDQRHLLSHPGARDLPQLGERAPDGFVFAVKGPGYVSNRKDLSESGPHIARFLESGLTELGGKLGPILWQLAPTKRFVADEIAGFLELLPRTFDGRRSATRSKCGTSSFKTPEFVALMRRRQAGRLRPLGQIRGDRGRHRRLRLRPPPTLERGARDGVCGGRTRSLGQACQGLGVVASRTACRALPGPRRRGGATASSISSPARRSGTRPARWR